MFLDFKLNNFMYKKGLNYSNKDMKKQRTVMFIIALLWGWAMYFPLELQVHLSFTGYYPLLATHFADDGSNLLRYR